MCAIDLKEKVTYSLEGDLAPRVAVPRDFD